MYDYEMLFIFQIVILHFVICKNLLKNKIKIGLYCKNFIFVLCGMTKSVYMKKYNFSINGGGLWTIQR